jgi:hypothetical protein
MRPFTQIVLAGAGGLLSLAPAIAQTPGQRIVIEQAGAPPRQEGQVRIQSSINFFVAGPTGEGDEVQKSAGTRAAYRLRDGRARMPSASRRSREGLSDGVGEHQY